MPEVFDDMTVREKTQTEYLRTGVINSLRNVYALADKAARLEFLLLRLHSGSMVDVAAVLCLSRWIGQLWPFTKTKLTNQVVLRSKDSTFDLDDIIQFLYETVNNEDSRYYYILTRLAPLRPTLPRHTFVFDYSLRLDFAWREIFFDTNTGCKDRYSDLIVDQARALFPVLDLKWQTRRTLQQGLRHIADSYPQYKPILQFIVAMAISILILRCTVVPTCSSADTTKSKALLHRAFQLSMRVPRSKAVL